MAKGRSSQRRVPSTPPSPGGVRPDSDAGLAQPADDATPEPELTPSGFVPLPEVAPPKPREVLILRGTGCLGGHVAGAELDAGPIGLVPSAKTTAIGLSILGWCLAGLLLLSRAWLLPALLLLGAWWAFSVSVQRRAGHRGRCLRVRAWRHAWGGLVPQTKDPTRPAEGEDD